MPIPSQKTLENEKKIKKLENRIDFLIAELKHKYIIEIIEEEEDAQ